MRRKRFNEEQIVSILNESAVGMKTEEICRRYWICTNTFSRKSFEYIRTVVYLVAGKINIPLPTQG